MAEDPVEPSSPAGSPVDGDALLAFTDRMETLLGRLDEDGVSDARRRRWERKLTDLVEAARRDLDDARDQLRRFEARIERRLDG